VRALVLALACALAACGGAGHPPPNGPPIAAVLPSADGGEVDFTRLRGRLVVVHVFATWSLAAQADVEQLDAVHAKNAVAVVGVALDLDGSVVLPPWQRGSGATYPIALADDDVRGGTSAFGAVDEVPITLMLNRMGTVVRRHVGPLAAGQLETWIRELQ
jgi:hypothetical protein